MPYIKQESRANLISGKSIPETSGELNFALTQHCIQYLVEKGKSYTTINDILGALEGAKLEFYRRVAAPYEDTKIKENGDVY